MASNHYNWKIFNSALIVAVISFLAKGLSACKDVIVAASLGTGELVDAFLLGALLPLLSVSVLSAPYASALVPIMTRMIVRGERRHAFQFFELNLLRIVAPLLIVALGGHFFAPDIARLLVPHEGSLLVHTTDALRILSCLVVLSGISQILIVALSAFEIFALPTLSQAFSPLLIVAALFFVPMEYRENALSIGAVAGNAIQLFFLVALYWVHRQCSVKASVTTNPVPDAPVLNREVLTQWFALFISALLMSSTDIIDQIMAAYIGPGAVATFSYGVKVPALLISVLAGSLTSAAFPYLSQMIERAEHVQLRQTLMTYTRLILIGASAMVVAIILCSLPLVQILFERGAFTSSDSLQVAFVQQMAILQVPFYLLNGLFMRVVMALRVGKWLAMVTVFSVLLNIGLNQLFSHWIGVAGIALSTSCVYLWSTVALSVLIFRKNER